MDSQNIMFVVLAVLIAASSVMTVLTKSIVRAATYLLFVLLGTAGFYFLLGYTFLGAVQIMVYAGGIIVLYVFSILLTRGKTDVLRRNSAKKVLSAALLSLLGLAVVAWVYLKENFKAQVLEAPTEFVGIEQIGNQMLATDKGGYLLPFEAVSLLLLACIVAGLLIARKR